MEIMKIHGKCLGLGNQSGRQVLVQVYLQRIARIFAIVDLVASKIIHEVRVSQKTLLAHQNIKLWLMLAFTTAVISFSTAMCNITNNNNNNNDRLTAFDPGQPG